MVLSYLTVLLWFINIRIIVSTEGFVNYYEAKSLIDMIHTESKMNDEMEEELESILKQFNTCKKENCSFLSKVDKFKKEEIFKDIEELNKRSLERCKIAELLKKLDSSNSFKYLCGEKAYEMWKTSVQRTYEVSDLINRKTTEIYNFLSKA